MGALKIQPWHRMEGLDTDDSWPVFVAYRDGPRALKPLAVKFGIPEKTIRAWSYEHMWRKRAREYDRWCDFKRIKANLADKRPADVRHLEAARTLGELAQVEAKKLLERAHKYKNSAVTPRELVRINRNAVDVERLVEGKPTDRIDNGPKHLDLSKLTAEELLQLRELQAKAGLAGD
jgi:hypothetical protein